MRAPAREAARAEEPGSFVAVGGFYPALRSARSLASSDPKGREALSSIMALWLATHGRDQGPGLVADASTPSVFFPLIPAGVSSRSRACATRAFQSRSHHALALATRAPHPLSSRDAFSGETGLTGRASPFEACEVLQQLLWRVAARRFRG